MRIFEAEYSTFTQFRIPSRIPLLSAEENFKIEDKNEEKIPWSWWIRWDKLYYYDASGEIQSIKSYFEGEPNYKRPDKVVSDDDGSESESESESDTD
jgi:hypothetical protein